MADLPNFRKGDGLVAAIAQDATTGTVLMIAYMNREAYERTLATGYAWYWSRSRQTLWMKGETSGHRQTVRAIHVDCDGDAILLRVAQEGGAACHEGYESCFYRRRHGDDWEVVAPRVFDPATVYRTPSKSPDTSGSR